MEDRDRYTLEEAASKISRVLNQDWNWRRLLQATVSDAKYVQVLCMADNVPVKEIDAVYTDFHDFIIRTIEPFESTDESYCTGIDAYWTGAFYPALSPDGTDYLNALAYGEESTEGITRIRDREDMSLKYVDMPGGYRPSYHRLFIGTASLAFFMDVLRTQKARYGIASHIPEPDRQKKYRSYVDSGHGRKFHNGFHYITPSKATELLAVVFGGDDALQMVLEGFGFTLGNSEYRDKVEEAVRSGTIKQFEEHFKHGWRRTPEAAHRKGRELRDLGWMRTSDIEQYFKCDLSGWIGQSTQKITTSQIEAAAKAKGIENKHISAIIDLYNIIYKKKPDFDFSTAQASTIAADVGLKKADLTDLVNGKMAHRNAASKDLYTEANFQRNVFQNAMKILRTLHGGKENIKLPKRRQESKP